MTSHKISREISVEVIPTRETGYIIHILCVQTRRLLVWKVVKTGYTSALFMLFFMARDVLQKRRIYIYVYNTLICAHALIDVAA